MIQWNRSILGGELGIISHVREKIITHDDTSLGLTGVRLQVTKALGQQFIKNTPYINLFRLGNYVQINKRVPSPQYIIPGIEAHRSSCRVL